jgi:hypothetical protein
MLWAASSILLHVVVSLICWWPAAAAAASSTGAEQAAARVLPGGVMSVEGLVSADSPGFHNCTALVWRVPLYFLTGC